MYIFICYIQERVNNRMFNYFTMYRVKVLYFNHHLRFFIKMRFLSEDYYRESIYFKLKMMTEMPCLLVKQIIKENTNIEGLNEDRRAGSILYTSREFPFFS